ncbi:branched-chain amino acid ABC transporter permease [Desulfatiglans anilini]|uniref:branched-chain amino acid ABC transporter permease n=1 Tax=Desulfatiglans anilini TaxID=90728 RepID=UPI00041631AC|nr:branched-chain amino acid ABC transporter permease [Desulfatiglans anilini]
MKLRRERIDRGIKARSGDVFALSSWREMFYLAFPRLLPIVGFIVLPLILGVYWQKVLISVAVFALLAISWDILAQSGMVSLGQALFFGMGAYASGVLNHSFGLSPFIAIPMGTLLGGLICTILLLPVLRLRGIYFAMVTLIIPLMLVRIIEATKVFGGTEGLSGLTPLPNVWVEVYCVVGALLAALFGFRRLMDSDFGLVLRGINDNDRSVMNAGIDVTWFKIQSLFMAGCIGAFAGAFTTHVYMFVGMPVFALDYSILPIAAAVVGGPGSLAGATLGASILVPLSEVLRGFGGLRIILYGVFLVVFIVALPEGLFPYIQRKYQQFERWVEVDK